MKGFPDTSIIDHVKSLAGDESHHLNTLYGILLREHNFIMKQSSPKYTCLGLGDCGPCSLEAEHMYPEATKCPFRNDSAEWKKIK